MGMIPQAARNIQRGRDHGLAGYGAFRAACGLSKPGDLCSWDDRPEDIPEERWEELRAVYEPDGNSPGSTYQQVINGTTRKLRIYNIDWHLLTADMDIITAGLAESPPEEEGSPVVGPTFACILAKQFKVIRDGDR